MTGMPLRYCGMSLSKGAKCKLQITVIFIGLFLDSACFDKLSTNGAKIAALQPRRELRFLT